MTTPARRRRGRQIRKNRRLIVQPLEDFARAVGVVAAQIDAFKVTMAKLAAAEEDREAREAIRPSEIEDWPREVWTRAIW